MWEGRAESSSRCERGEPSTGANVAGVSPFSPGADAGGGAHGAELLRERPQLVAEVGRARDKVRLFCQLNAQVGIGLSGNRRKRESAEVGIGRSGNRSKRESA